MYRLLFGLILCCYASLVDKFFSSGGTEVVKVVIESIILPGQAMAEGDVEDSPDEGSKNIEEVIEQDIQEALEGGEIVSTMPRDKIKEALHCRGIGDTEKLLLSNLHKRHEKLKNLNRLILEKENSLNVIENLLDNKVRQLGELKERVEELLHEYHKEEEAQIVTLVKVYENMKPVESSSIFNNLNPELLVEVASRMKSDKLSLILSKMEKDRAREVTIDLANYRRLEKFE